jgi:hypothetical protein
MADRAWLDRLPEFLDAEMLSGRTRERVLHLAELIAGRCDWDTVRSRPTLAFLVEQTGLCLRTVQRWTRRLERAGWLQVLVHGATPRYAPDRLAAEGGNEAREWLLTIPGPVIPGDSAVTPSLTPTASRPSPGAREDPPSTDEGQDMKDRRSAPPAPSLTPPRWPGQAPEWPLGQLPQRRGERLTAAATLQRDHMVLRRLSARRLRSILRPWFGTPWQQPRIRYTPLDVLYALDHLPDGRQHEYAGQVRDPAAHLEHRMSFWLGPAGSPIPPHSAELAERAAAHSAEHGRRRAARQASEAARLTPDPSGSPAARGAALARQYAEARGGQFAAALTRHTMTTVSVSARDSAGIPDARLPRRFAEGLRPGGGQGGGTSHPE